MAGFSFQRQRLARPPLPRSVRIADHTPSLVRSGSVASQIFYETSGTTSRLTIWADHRDILRLSPPERRYADVLGLSDWPRYPDSGLAEPKGNKLHDLR